MNALVDSITKWLTQKPVEPSVMAAIPSRARLASDTQADRESRAEILRVLGMLPVPGSDLAQVAGDLVAESETTPLGVAKAVAGAMMPVRGGPGKINVMGEASKVNPDVLMRIKKSLARGLSAKEAYQQENALPLARSYTKGVEDAWVPLLPPRPLPSPEYFNKYIAARAENLRNLTKPGDTPESIFASKFGSIWQPKDVELMAKHYPELMEVPTYTTVDMARTKGAGAASIYPGDKLPSIELAGSSLHGGEGILPIAAHEGTHALQFIEGLPKGFSPEAVAKEKNRLVHLLELNTANSKNPWDKRAADSFFSGMVSLPPGEGPLPGSFGKASPETQSIIRALASIERGTSALGAKELDYRMYKAFHGEQAAEGARQFTSGQPVAFTTPLSKQVFSPYSLSNTQYGARLQRLYELKKAGLFDPLASPYELPATK